MTYDEAARALYQVPLGNFVEERKRHAAALKAAGDKAGAAKLGKLARPPVSAWAVNQLYWHARDTVDRVFAAAARLREGDLSVTSEHREALAAVRTRAATLLADAGHGANEATVRRIALTVSALAAQGSWAPDAPGQLGEDRDPPGFEAVGVINPPSAPLPDKPVEKPFPFPAVGEVPAVIARPPPPPPPPPAPSPPPPPVSEPAGDKKPSALDELKAKRRQRAAEAAEENRRRFIEDGGSREAVIAWRLQEREEPTTRREAVEKLVAQKVAAPQITPPPARTTLSASELLGAKPVPTLVPKPAANDIESDADRRKKAARAKLRTEIHARLDKANTVLDAAEQRVSSLQAALDEARTAFEEARVAVDELRDQLDALE